MSATPQEEQALNRADFIIQDILENHLPRLKESLETGYVDENQALVIYDHMLRVRVLREQCIEQMRVHFMREGRTACIMGGVPRDWPPGHAWAEDWKLVTCPLCLKKKGNIAVPPLLT
jgi:hypothetical protein